MPGSAIAPMYAGIRVAIIIGEEDDVAAGIVGADKKALWIPTAALLTPHGCPQGGRFRFEEIRD
jgi:hypothetical protein